MRSLTKLLVLLAVLIAPASIILAQGTDPAANTGASATASATKAEVDQLRGEVAAQRQTIEELKAMVEKLVTAKAPATDNSSAQIRPVSSSAPPEASSLPVDGRTGSVHLMNAVLLEAEPTPVAAVVDQAPATAPKKDPPLTAGWNGEHFFIRSSDGQFTISPYGYVDNDYRA
jgi:hypothetical protein